VEQC